MSIAENSEYEATVDAGKPFMSNRIPVLTETVTRLSAEITHHTEQAALKGIEAGEALCEAKELVPHGGWSGFLKDCGINDRTAQRYMRLYRAGFNSATVADLGIASAERQARTIEAIRKAGEGSARLRYRLPVGDLLDVYAWQYEPEYYFITMVDFTPAKGNEEDIPRMSAAGFKKQIGARGVATVIERVFPKANFTSTEAASHEHCKDMNAALGFRLVKHGWGTWLYEHSEAIEQERLARAEHEH